MLWVPGVFALLAALFLTQALLQSLAQGLHLLASVRSASQRRWAPPQPARHAVPPPARPPLQQAADPYRQACEQLGVPPGSSWPVIRAAWRRQLSQWHPDRGGDPERWHTRLAAYRLLDASTPRVSVRPSVRPSVSPSVAVRR
jgi:DnaJ-domain-containing protein 1